MKPRNFWNRFSGNTLSDVLRHRSLSHCSFLRTSPFFFGGNLSLRQPRVATRHYCDLCVLCSCSLFPQDTTEGTRWSLFLFPQSLPARKPIAVVTPSNLCGNCTKTCCDKKIINKTNLIQKMWRGDGCCQTVAASGASLGEEEPYLARGRAPCGLHQHRVVTRRGVVLSAGPCEILWGSVADRPDDSGRLYQRHCGARQRSGRGNSARKWSRWVCSRRIQTFEKLYKKQ